ncbi:MAG: Alpha-ketoglutarate-dependent taurine dioxygenase, partial [Actinomycetota bacterium]
KPNGYLQVLPGKEKEFLAPLSVGEIPGVGEHTLKSLHTLGIMTIQDLAVYPSNLMEQYFGKYGEILVQKALGQYEGSIHSEHESKSISTEHTFFENTGDLNFLLNELKRMTEKLGHELRGEKRMTRCVAVKIRYPDFQTQTKQLSIAPTCFDDEIIKVVKEADEGKSFNFGGAWHSDFSFQVEPPSFTILAAVDLPPWGGDTVFSSMSAAWDELPQVMKDQVLSLQAVHTARDAYSRRMQPLHSGMRGMEFICDDSANAEQRHPLVCRHPETGRWVLFFNRAYVRDIDGMDHSEAEALMAFLHQHTTEARFTYRHRWQLGDVVIWDNRSTQHLALNDYAGFRRELNRTTVAGSRPQSANSSLAFE